MKILHVINSLATGGAEKLVADTLPLYAEKGIAVDLLLLNGVKHPFYEELEKKKCCRIFILGYGSVYNPKHIFGIVPHLKNYDLVHVHLFPSQYFVVLAKLISRSATKLVFTEHSTSNRRFRDKKLKIIDRKLYGYYNKIIAITESVREQVMRHTHTSFSKIDIIQNGVLLEEISSAEPLKIEELAPKLKSSDLLILQVSSFQEPKDQSTVIRAMCHLPENYKLLLVGAGKMMEQCRTLAVDLGVDSRVFFLGIRNDVPSLLKTADIVVLSSKYEGLSLSSIEGMASGKPFIASNVPGLKEIVEGAGLLFPLGDEQKLAEEIRKLATDGDYYKKIASQSKKRAELYGISTMVEKHISLYKELCKK